MKAIVLTKFGGTESFELQNVSVPEVDIGELRVRVVATAINPLDYQIRRGDQPEYVPLPATIGHDVSGFVEKVGLGVTNFKVGDEVFYTPKTFGPNGDSYAEYNVVPEVLVTHKPATCHLKKRLLQRSLAEQLEKPSFRVLNFIQLSLCNSLRRGWRQLNCTSTGKGDGVTLYTTCRSNDFDFVRQLNIGPDQTLYEGEPYADDRASSCQP